MRIMIAATIAPRRGSDGPRQRAVLALLLAARCEFVSVGRMIEELGRGDAPPRAIVSLSTPPRIGATTR
ncbi:hypothetical protein ACFYPH_06890 [Micromonospora sp. NPDC005252]|uniref:hypothetical protein n=1 Tax=Micromonospora sp. NPDC005252 TaxID=3364228 RepID=UPI003698BE89